MSKDILQRKRILTKASSGSSISTPVSVANGGTGLSSYTVGDLIYASGATTLSKLADVATGSVLVSGGVGVAPSWSNSPTFGGFVSFEGSTGSLGVGKASTYNGGIVYRNSTNANTISIVSGVTSSTYSLTLPTAQGGASTVLTNNGSGVLSWTTPSSGITVGTTTITSGTSTRVPFNDGGVYGESADFTFNDATNVLQIGATNVSTNSLNIGGAKALQVSQLTAGNGGSITIGNTTTSVTGGGAIIIGNFASASNNGAVAIGGDGGPSGGTTGASAGQAGVAIGGNFYGAASCGYRGVTIGTRSSSSGDGNTILGHFNTGGAFTETILLGSGLTATASHQVIIGGGYSNLSGGIYFGGVTSTTSSAVIINACGGSGTNNAGANLTLAAGKSTGSATPAVINFQSTAAGASSSTAQTLATVLQITNSTTITTSDAVNYALGSTTGTKFGTATTQKIGFWNATPIVQPSGATQAAPAAYATGAFGLDSDANMQALYDLVVAIRTALVNVGIMKGSA